MTSSIVENLKKNVTLRSNFLFFLILALEVTSPYVKQRNTKVLWSRYTRTR